MPKIFQETEGLTIEVLVKSMQTKPLSPSVHLAGDRGSPSESQSPQVNGNWQKRENAEHSDGDEDVKLHEMMENIKRYIRSIDISNL